MRQRSWRWAGTGVSTAAMAADEPGVDVIAVEVYKPGLAQLLGLIDRGRTHQRPADPRRRDGGAHRTHRTRDARRGAGVLPDPWPKSRHHKRRFLQSGTIELIADRLRPGGILHIATDHADYAVWIAEFSRPRIVTGRTSYR